MIDPTRDLYDSAAVERARATLDAVPETIGRYRIRERIGGGGMGEVYVAEQTAPLKRRVALKVIKAGMDTKQVVARFEAERQALAMMDHPNIARVFDAGATETGRPYFVMELVRGVPITQFCDESKLSTRQRVELLVPVCQAVQHAHQKGIIHRDIKPTNVLVTLHDGKPVPKVIDFGIAKATSQPLTDKTVYTEFRAMIGTPAYMSPEQAEMSGLDIDTRSDIYSLGVLMYELLTGTTPFDTTRLVKAGLLEIQRIIKEEEPPRPSLRISSLGQTLPSVAAHRDIEPARLGKLVAGELDWIVMRALEKDRRRRYETANDLAADLERHLAGEPIVAAPASAAYRARKFVGKHRTAVLTGVVLAATLATGVVATTWQWRNAQANAQKAIERGDVATAQRTEAERQRDAAETASYIANLALGQSSMSANRWPEARQRLDACPRAKRGWEWTFLASKARQVAHYIPTLGYTLQISGDGTLLRCSDGLWDLRTGKIVEGRPDNAMPLESSPDGKHTLMELSDIDREHRELFIVTKGDIGHTPSVPYENGMAAAVQWDCGRIILVRHTGTLETYDFAGNKLTTAPLDETVSQAVIRVAANRIATREEGRLRVRDLSGKLLKEMRNYYGIQWAFSPLGDQFVTGSSLSAMMITNIPSPNRPFALMTYGNVIYNDAGESFLAQSPRVTRLWDRRGCLTGSFRGEMAGDSAMFIKGTNDVVIWASEAVRPDVRVVHLSDFDSPWTEWDSEQWIDERAALFSALGSDQSSTITSSLTQVRRTDDRRLGVFVQGKFEGTLANYEFDDTAVSAVSPDGRRIVTTASDLSVRFWDSSLLQELVSIPIKKAVKQLRFTRDGTQLALEFTDGSAEVWDTRDASERQVQRDARFAELPAAREFVTELLGGGTPTSKLRDAVMNSNLLTGDGKLAAMDQIRLRLNPFNLWASGASSVEQSIRFATSSPNEELSSYLDAARGADQLAELPTLSRAALTTIGLAYYRAARYEESTRFMRRAIAAHDKVPYESSTDAAEIFLAMGEFKLGHASEARKSIEDLQKRNTFNPNWGEKEYLEEAITLLGLSPRPQQRAPTLEPTTNE